MTITFPRDLPACGFPESEFELRRQQVRALAAGGSPQAADIGPALWTASFRLDTVQRADTALWRAWLSSLRGGLRTFKGRPPGHKWPLAYPRGFAGLIYSAAQWDGTGNLSAISSGRDEVTINQLPDGFTLQPGDFFSFSHGTRNHLHRITEGAVASTNALTVTVEPIIRPDIATGAEIEFAAPWCNMALADDPSVVVRDNKFASIGFKAAQVLI